MFGKEVVAVEQPLQAETQRQVVAAQQESERLAGGGEIAVRAAEQPAEQVIKVDVLPEPGGEAGVLRGPASGPAPGARSAGPRRPPLRLTQPSTRSAKNGVFRRRCEVIPPWEWPTSQKARIRSAPSASISSGSTLGG